MSYSTNFPRRRRFPWLLAVLVLIPLVFIGGNMAMRSTQETVTATVTEKERIHNTGGGGHYLIFTENETFKIGDSLTYFQFSGSDMYGRIKTGETYHFTVYGWRAPFMSAYRNIVEVEKVQ